MNRVLFYDDEAMISLFLVMNLQDNYGWDDDEKQIVFVDSIRSLITEIIDETHRFDLFILDVFGPYSIQEENGFSREEISLLRQGRAGIAIAKRIRRMDKYKNVPILFLTATHHIPKIENSYIIQKPCDATELSEFMLGILNSASGTVVG